MAEQQVVSATVERTPSKGKIGVDGGFSEDCARRI
eukprot:IDg7539t1